MWRPSHLEMTAISWSSVVSVVSGLVDIPAQENIFPNLARFQPRQRDRRRKPLDEPRPRARDRRRHEEHQLVDELGAEERRSERRPAFEEQRLDVLLRKPAQLLLERPAQQLELRPGR